MNSDVVICIPARYQSSRLPGKPLIEIAGKPLILWAIKSASKIKCKQMVVATDDERIKNIVEKAGYSVVMTSSSHQTGTDRIAEVVNMMSWTDETIVVNYQGDEPLTPVENINQLVDSLVENTQASIATLYQDINSFEDLIDPNNVKLVCDENDMALYFSRSAIPFSRECFKNNMLDEDIIYKHHVGLYAYRAGFLKKFSQLTPSKLEESEALEQLRAMSYGFKIIAKKAIKKMPHGIDTLSDVVKFEKSLSL